MAAEPARQAPSGSSDLLDFMRPEFLRDPYPTYRALRDAGPLHRISSGSLRFWVLTRHADVQALLRDPRVTVERIPGMSPDPNAPPVDPATLNPLARTLRTLARVMLFRDPPDHTRLRGLANKAFTPRMVEALRPRIAALVDELLAPLGDGAPFDVVRELAEPLPILVIAELLGLPGEDRKELKAWSDDLAVLLDGSIAMQHIGRGVQSAIQVFDYLRKHLEEKRRRPQDDLLSAMIAARDRDENLTDDEILATALLVMGAGHETTTNLVGNATLALLRNPGELARLRAEPALLPGAVEEFLRYDAPVQGTARMTREPIELHGTLLPARSEVLLPLACANRDPAVFADPDRLDVGRADARHVSFGYGIHFCLGAGLARLEAQLAIGGLLAHAPRLAPAFEEAELVWRPGWLLRGLTALPVQR
jgi:pimeloyl-[acyl-carrier protein] synthase